MVPCIAHSSALRTRGSTSHRSTQNRDARSRVGTSRRGAGAKFGNSATRPPKHTCARAVSARALVAAPPHRASHVVLPGAHPTQPHSPTESTPCAPSRRQQVPRIPTTPQAERQMHGQHPLRPSSRGSSPLTAPPQTPRLRAHTDRCRPSCPTPHKSPQSTSSRWSPPVPPAAPLARVAGAAPGDTARPQHQEQRRLGTRRRRRPTTCSTRRRARTTSSACTSTGTTTGCTSPSPRTSSSPFITRRQCPPGENRW